MNTLALAGYLVVLVDKVPKDNDVKAGWGAFFIFLGLAAAVAFLGWSLVRQLRKAKLAAQAGVYGPEDVSPPEEPEEGKPGASEHEEEARPGDSR